ncbi:MAG: ABC transporter ATP-binding protein, partial [Coriobacteriales bacterium]|nr:ABC transporter ATP-binding protein [Coriobacteriales bacterium]
IPYLRSLQQKIDQLNLVTRESLTGVQVIRAFNKQKWDDSRFDRANTDYCETNIKIGKMIAILMPLITLLISTVMISIYWVGANLLQSGALMVGDIMAVAQYATMILMSVMMLSMLFAVLPRAMAAAARINEVIEKEPSIIDGPDAEDAVASPLPGSSIVFEDVTYTFKGAEKPTLESLNFTIEPGETAVIIGATGSGKTTILNLIMRFLEPTSGRVLIDGQDVSKVKQASLREKISYVSQKALLFSGTIKDNILFGNQDASDEDVFRAAKYAVADEFIANKQDGYDYELTQSGSNLSGGQRQRMSIARALLKRSNIYMFDDSFSALDFSTDLKIRSALPKLIGDATMLVVAQRVNVAMGADKIIVLDEGRVVGIGTHEELMESCEVYNDIAMSQITEEDIERTSSNKPKASAEEVSSDGR